MVINNHMISIKYKVKPNIHSIPVRLTYCEHIMITIRLVHIKKYLGGAIVVVYHSHSFLKRCAIIILIITRAPI